MIEPEPPPSKPRSWLRTAVGAAGYVAIVALAWNRVDHQRVLEGLGRLHAIHIVALVGVALLHIALRSFRFHRLVLRAGPNEQYTLADGVAIFIVGLCTSAVTPARAGDLVKAHMVRRFGVSLPAGVGLVAIERMLDLLVMAGSTVVMGLFVSERAGSAGWSRAALVLLGGLAIGAACITVRRIRQPLLQTLIKVVRKLRKSTDEGRAIHALEDTFKVWDTVFTSPVSFGAYMLLSAFLWTVEFSKLWLVLRLLGVAVPTSVVLFAYPVSLLAGVLTLLPFSEGVVGVTSVALLAKLASIDSGTATVAVVLDRAASIVTPMVLWALIVLGGRLARSAKATN